MLNIYVGNLPYSTDEQELEQLFSQFGQVDRANVITDRETGRSRGFGFVEMADETEGHQAIEALHGQSYNGRALTVNEARPRAARPAGGGYAGRASSY
ncbi:MAG: RNA-binding protein [Phycisphaeraceae bacterium]